MMADVIYICAMSLSALVVICGAFFVIHTLRL